MINKTWGSHRPQLHPSQLVLNLHIPLMVPNPITWRQKRASEQRKGNLQQLFPSANYLILLHSLQSQWQHQRQVNTAAMPSLVLPWPGVETLMPNIQQWQQRNMTQIIFAPRNCSYTPCQSYQEFFLCQYYLLF